MDDLVPEVKRLLTPFGQVSSLSKSNTLVILDTVGNVRRILDTIQVVERGSDAWDSVFHVHQCKWKKADEIAAAVRTRLAEKPGAGAPDASQAVRIVVERSSNSVVLVSGPAAKLEQAKKLIAELDKPKNPGDKPFKNSDPELRRYSVPAGTADAIAKTLLAEDPALRIIAVQVANEIWVMATSEEHAALEKKLAVVQPGAAKLPPN